MRDLKVLIEYLSVILGMIRVHVPAGRAVYTRLMDEYLTEAEVAALLKVTRGTVKRWRREGVGPPSLRFGRAVRYRRRDVDAWAERQREAPEERS